MRKLIFLFLLFNIFFTACKKSDDETLPNNSELLVGDIWKGDKAEAQATGSPFDPFLLLGVPSDSTVDLTGSTIQFREDGTFTASGLGALIEQEVEGTWELLEDDTKIRLEGLDLTIEPPTEFAGLFELTFSNVWEIKTITSTSLILSNSASTVIDRDVISTLLGTPFPSDLTVSTDLDVTYFR